MKREPYTGPVMDLDAAMKSVDINKPGPVADEKTADPADPFHQRPPTSSGGRNMQDSSFALSGTYICHAFPHSTAM